MPIDADRRTLLPFYEAYFSNYIEGTEFTLEEASDIVFGGVVPEQRPAEAHDILSTYELTNSVVQMRRAPKSPKEYVELLRSRHGVILGGRPHKGPGQFKARAIMMNSELAAAGEVRVIIPTVYRLNYVGALKAATHGNNFAALLATLSFARRWTGRTNVTNRATAESDFDRTYALREAQDAEDAGVRLTLP